MARRPRVVKAEDEKPEPLPEAAPEPASLSALSSESASSPPFWAQPWFSALVVVAALALFAWSSRAEADRRAQATAERLDAIEAALAQTAATAAPAAPAPTAAPTVIVRNIIPPPRQQAKQAEPCSDCPVVRRVVRTRNGRARLE